MGFLHGYCDPCNNEYALGRKKKTISIITKKECQIMPQPWKRRVRQMSSAQIIVTFYIVAVTLGFLLLSIPEALKPGVKLAFIDRLFISVSAVSVTGLTPVSTPDTFSTMGYFCSLLFFKSVVLV